MVFRYLWVGHLFLLLLLLTLASFWTKLLSAMLDKCHEDSTEIKRMANFMFALDTNPRLWLSRKFGFLRMGHGRNPWLVAT